MTDRNSRLTFPEILPLFGYKVYGGFGICGTPDATVSSGTGVSLGKISLMTSSISALISEHTELQNMHTIETTVFTILMYNFSARPQYMDASPISILGPPRPPKLRSFECGGPGNWRYGAKPGKMGRVKGKRCMEYKTRPHHFAERSISRNGIKSVRGSESPHYRRSSHCTPYIAGLDEM
jgi:hypothetical protein